MSLEDSAAEDLAKIENAMRQAGELLRAHDGDREAQAIAAGPALFDALHALWGWAITTHPRIEFLEDDLLALQDLVEKLKVIRREPGGDARVD